MVAVVEPATELKGNIRAIESSGSPHAKCMPDDGAKTHTSVADEQKAGTIGRFRYQRCQLGLLRRAQGFTTEAAAQKMSKFGVLRKARVNNGHGSG